VTLSITVTSSDRLRVKQTMPVVIILLLHQSDFKVFVQGFVGARLTLYLALQLGDPEHVVLTLSIVVPYVNLKGACLEVHLHFG